MSPRNPDELPDVVLVALHSIATVGLHRVDAPCDCLKKYVTDAIVRCYGGVVPMSN